ncbi:MAG TPA: DUF2147 domain-containing protein [Burkholderiaceae bacterium]|nr:DUF2147 domain-containing protein [Burkholderiaceae bacterium]
MAVAQATPVGLWKTIDDKTEKEKSLVRITEAGGVFTGTIEKVLDPEAPPDAKCVDCKDERRDKPVLGFLLIRNVKQSADDASIWDGGDITDPNNGKVYRVRLRPVDAGKRLEVRGYVGPFYRTQHWQRVE